MAESLLVGAAVGAVFGELLNAILEIGGKANKFKQTLASLRSTLVQIEPVIEEIEQQNKDLGRPKEELDSLIIKMKEGTQLVRKCSKIHRLNYPARIRYHEQLEALRYSLEKFFIIDMQAQSTRDLKETLFKVRKMYSWVNKFPSVNVEDTTGSSSVSHESKIQDSTADEIAEETNYTEEAMDNISQLTRNSSGEFSLNGDEHESDLPHSTATQPAENEAKVMEPLTSIVTGSSSVSHESKIQDSTADEIAEETNYTEEDMDNISQLTRNSSGDEHESDLPHSTATQPAENEAKAMEPLTSIVHESTNKAENNQGMQHLMNKRSYEQSAKKSVLGICQPSIQFKREVKQSLQEGLEVKISPQGVVFLDCSFSFSIKDWLNAAELIGVGSYGETYKVILEDEREVVVRRRLSNVVGKREFEEQVKILHTLISEHPNVIPISAYYYSEDEQILIYDCIIDCSLSWLLQGSKLNWDSRMKIAHGAAVGIAHIHSAGIVHGNIESSSILVTKDMQGCIYDFGLKRLTRAPVNPSGNEGHRDVYSFGVLLLEMLTGESPAQNTWLFPNEVQCIERWTKQVSDPKLKLDRKSQVLDMLQLTMECVEWNPHLRPSMAEVVKKMEKIRGSSEFQAK